MKLHYVLAAGAAALLLLAGCESGVTEVSESGKAVSVPVWFESIGGPSTKVDVDGDTGFGTWTPGDQIAIYVQGTGANFYQIKNVESIEDAPENNIGHVMVSLAENQDRANYAIYPASAAVDGHVTEGDLYVNYPAEYDLRGINASQLETYSPTPMVAINTPVTDFDDPTIESEALKFYHVGGVLRVTVPGVQQSAYALRLTFPEGLKFSGTFKVNNGGTLNSTLEPVGDDHSNVITIILPILEEAIQDLTFNIPLPTGDYSTTDRSYKVDVRTERIAYMRSDGVMNFSSIGRAQGKKQSLPTVYSLGTMADLYLTRGILKRPNPSTVNPSDMTITGNDQLEILNYRDKDINNIAKMCYFSWSQLGMIMGEEMTIEIDGIQYRVPSAYDYNRICYGSRPGAIVNGHQGSFFSKVTIDLTGSPYASEGSINGLLLYPDGGVYECSSLTGFNTTQAGSGNNNISYADYRRLTNGPNNCVLLTVSYRIRSGRWDRDAYGLYWLSDPSENGLYWRYYGGGGNGPLSSTAGDFAALHLVTTEL